MLGQTSINLITVSAVSNLTGTRALFKDDANLIQAKIKSNLKLITILVNLKFQHKSPIFMQI